MSNNTDTNVTTRQYVDALRESAKHAFIEGDCVCWVQSERFTLERRPLFVMERPSEKKVREFLWNSRMGVASYLLPADAALSANSLLYLCENRNYCLEDLSSAARRDARRAIRAFHFEFLEPATLLESGLRCFADTRERVGLSDGTPAAFKSYIGGMAKNPAYKFVGALIDNNLAAFMWILTIDDWAAIAAYSANEHLRSCPNNGLIHFALDYCLTQKRCRVVSYGLSSIQEVSRAMTLDSFKKKVGFEIHPVHRAFVLHPLLWPFVNRLSYWCVRCASRIWPRNRLLRKGTGLLANSLGLSHLLEMPSSENHPETTT